VVRLILLMVPFLVASTASAQSVLVGPTASVVADGFRPGVRLGFEPAPPAAVDVQMEMGRDGGWNAGLSLAGRWWVSPQKPKGEGLYLLGRFTAGLSEHPSTAMGPWTGLAGGFGLRPISMLQLEAGVGPEWSHGSGRWRSEMGLNFVIDGKTFRSRPGHGSIRHRPRPIPDE